MRFIIASLVIVFFSQCSQNDQKQIQIAEQPGTIGKIITEKAAFEVPDIPNEITFAGEEINLTDVDVRERFDRELVVNNFWHSNTILYIKRANRWFPMIKEMLRENGVPEDFVYLSVIESGLTQATSPSGAKGFWQFLKPTAQEYGLIVNREIDERLNVEKSTQAACRYLKKAYQEFGTWSLAAASYNMGMNGVRRALEKQQVDSYFDLSLNEETSRYVFRMLAIKEIMEDPEKFGFEIDPHHLYPEYELRRMELKESIADLADWARQQETSLKVIRRLNPWILRDRISAHRYRNLSILIPVNREQLGLYKG